MQQVNVLLLGFGNVGQAFATMVRTRVAFLLQSRMLFVLAVSCAHSALTERRILMPV